MPDQLGTSEPSTDTTRQVALVLSLVTAMLVGCAGSSDAGPKATATVSTTATMPTPKRVPFVAGRCWLKVRAEVTDGVDFGSVFSYRMKVTVTRSRVGLVGREARKNGASIVGEMMVPGVPSVVNVNLYIRNGGRIVGNVSPFGGCAKTPAAHGPFQGPGQTDYGTLTIVRAAAIAPRYPG